MEEKNVAKVLGDFIRDQEENGKSVGTIKTYTRILREFSEWLEKNGGSQSQLTRMDIQQYINYLEDKGNSAVTIENKFAALSVFIHYLDCPSILQHIRRPEYRKTQHIAPKSLERKERNRILREVERSQNQRNTAIVYLLFYTGLRVSELISLNRKDIVIGERSGTVFVRKGKGGVARKVPLPVDARIYLNHYLQTREDDNDALFLSNYKKRISVRSIQRILEKYGVHPHQLRHTYCRELVSSGVDIATVAELAGHADINMTRRYSKPSHDELDQAIEKTFGL